MKKLSKKTIFWTIAVVVVLIAAALYFVAPSYLYNKAINGFRKDAGLTVKSVNIPDFKIVYAEGGTGDTIIMLHGFGGSKDNWLRFAKYFTPNYRVIIPDLPGFGDSSKTQDAKYNIMSQVERLHLLVKELKLIKFNIVGNSMGGDIAGNYAVAYPGMVKTLALFDSAGVVSPVKSERALLLEKGINPLVVKDEKGYDRLLEITFNKPIQLPSIIKKYLTKKAIKDAPLNEKIYNELTNTDLTVLEGKLNKITAPTLIVWGDSDKVIDVSSVPIFKKNIKNSQAVIIKECGHLPMLEKPQETASIYKDFLKGENQRSTRPSGGDSLKPSGSPI
jgi:abhydrolase domain-containing protein 6